MVNTEKYTKDDKSCTYTKFIDTPQIKNEIKTNITRGLKETDTYFI